MLLMQANSSNSSVLSDNDENQDEHTENAMAGEEGSDHQSWNGLMLKQIFLTRRIRNTRRDFKYHRD